MPLKFRIRIPVSQAHPNFATRARQRGLGSLLTQQRVALPGPNLFTRYRGMGVINTQQPVMFPGPNIFPTFQKRGVRRSRGMGTLVLPRGAGAFCIQADPPPVFPGRNIFAQFQLPGRCSSCKHPCRKGMGDDTGGDFTISAFGDTTDLTTTTSSSDLYPLETTDYWGSLTAPSSTGLPELSTLDSNPGLNAYNQALTNALGSGQSTAQAIAIAAAAAAKAGASIAEISQLNNYAQTSGKLTPGGTLGSISGWLSNNISTVAVLGAAVVGVSLLAKGKR